MKVKICFGQDTPAYTTIHADIPDGFDPTTWVKEHADVLLDEAVFEPSYDWDGLRIVEMSASSTGEVICEDEPVGRMSRYDIGLLAIQLINENWAYFFNANAAGIISDELLLKLRDLTRS